jgi:hypothetical protein
MYSAHGCIPQIKLAYAALQHRLQEGALAQPRRTFSSSLAIVRDMIPSKSSSRASGALTVSEWTAIASSLAFLVLWLAISFN